LNRFPGDHLSVSDRLFDRLMIFLWDERSPPQRPARRGATNATGVCRLCNSFVILPSQPGRNIKRRMNKVLKLAGSLVAGVLLCCSIAKQSGAQAESPPGRDALQRIIECQTIVPPTERLACYDSHVRELGAARARRDIVIVDREQVRQTRRSLFGLNLPRLSILESAAGPASAADDKTAAVAAVKASRAAADDVDSIETTLASVQSVGLGQWLFVLTDGARWMQADDAAIGRKPKPGDKIVIRRAALGSFKLSINGGSAVRVRRVN
jgi:hypothetical protein